MDNVRSAVREFILTSCLAGEEASSLKDDTLLRADGILDSMMLLQLVSFLEENVGIEIKSHDVNGENFETVDSIVAFVQAKAPK